MISVDDAVREISNGKIIIYPTDTVWGIGCDAFNQDAVDRLFKLKEKKEPGVSVILNNKEQIRDFCMVNEYVTNISDNFLPGPITLILKSKKEFANGVTRDGNIGIRIPKHKISLELAKKTPIITTSANKHGEKIAANIDEAKEIFGKECLYIDGKPPEGIESTIIDMTNEKPEIKRIGALYSTILEGIVEN